MSVIGVSGSLTAPAVPMTELPVALLPSVMSEALSAGGARLLPVIDDAASRSGVVATSSRSSTRSLAERSLSESRRKVPRYVSPLWMLIVSLPFGARVNVFALIQAMRHLPFSAPLESRTMTQWPAKCAGMFAVRLVMSVAALLPACAVPLPSDGSSVACAVAP